MHPLLTTEALRGSRARNAFCAALICLLAVSETALADTDTTDHDAGNDVRIDVGIGRFEGKYGLDDTTTVDLLNITGRWYLPRGELQVSLPYLRIDGPADIRFVGGQPATGPGTGLDGQRTESGIGDVVLVVRPTRHGVQLPQLIRHDQGAGAHVGLEAGLLRLRHRQPLIGVEQPVDRAGHDAHDDQGDQDLDEGEAAALGHGNQHSM